ncbi:MAG TPA: sodium:calcium symporter [Opitutaceae bacterium]|nr:sodium:calcium symporter [Opitutaceae bacterium]
MNVTDFVESLGLSHPLTYAALFIAASLLMIWRLEAMGRHGLEGTALGTLITPYCSGLGNLLFVYLIFRDGGAGSGAEVMTNCLVNNVTNLTLVLALPAVIWGLEIVPQSSSSAKSGKGKPQKKARTAHSGKVETEKRLSRLSLTLTLAAVAFFTGTAWALGADGKLDSTDGLVLVGLFLFWQCFQVIDVMKHNVRQKKTFSPMFYVDLIGVLIGAVLLYISLDWLTHWLGTQKSGFISQANIGWLSGWLMVLPNALLALYYGAKGRADVVYASQVGDGHICIPLCVGLYALLKPLALPAFFTTSLLILAAALVVHFIAVVVLGRLPRFIGWGLIAAYSYFVYTGVLS